ncbi:hypothetical protein F5146DRAFT_1018860 [Armillaria mellea]|nr:hypothetical protein F5146DRAFT_1018860 [Armillaria mellea]
MSVAPTTTGRLGLQPSYFTSSVYVNPVRDDIAVLVKRFEEQYSNSPQLCPFKLFKRFWCSQGWQWLHLKIFDPRGRDVFLHTTLRLFLECTVDLEKPIKSLVALFGLYTFFYTQPTDVCPPLHSVEHIPIPCDQYATLISIPDTLTTAELKPFKPAVLHILKILVTSQIFHILPASGLDCQNPRTLPREIVIPDVLGEEGPKRKGRPTKGDRVKRSKVALDNLDQWMQKTSPPGSSDLGAKHRLITNPPAEPTLLQYQMRKEMLLHALDSDPEGKAHINEANEEVFNRLKLSEELAEGEVESDSGPPGLRRVQRAMKEKDREGRRGGLLGLLEGAGR